MEESKTTNFTKWIIGILLAVNIFSITIVWILVTKEKRPPHEMNHEKPPAAEKMLQKELNLTDQQVIKFEELRKENFERMKVKIDKLNELKRQLSGQIFVAAKDTVKINRLTGEIGELQAGMEKLLFNHFSELVSLCSDEQKEKFKPILQKVISGNPPGNMPERKPGFEKGNREDGRPPFERGDGPPPFDKPDNN